RVLVEQRVVVDPPRLSDPGRGVDERDLAEPATSLVGVDVRGDEVAIGFRVGVEPYEPAADELPAQSLDQPAAERERERAAERAARRARLGAREDLFGRHVRSDDTAVLRRLRAADPARAGTEADVERRAGAT